MQGNIHGDMKFLKDFNLHSKIDGNFDWNQSHLFCLLSLTERRVLLLPYSNTNASLLFSSYDNYWELGRDPEL